MVSSGTSLWRFSKLDLIHWYRYGTGRYGRCLLPFFLPAVEDSNTPGDQGDSR